MTNPNPFPVPEIAPQRPSAEFEIEGYLTIDSISGYACFKIDECVLSEFVAFHFKSKWANGRRDIGKVKLLIVPVQE